MSSEKALSKEWATPVNRVEAYHRTLIAYKNIAQSVLHAGNIAEAEVNLAWEIIEEVMQGLIDVFIDWFPDEETEKNTKVDELEEQGVTQADLDETRRELGMVQERNMTNFVELNHVLDKVEKLSYRVDDLEMWRRQSNEDN